MGQLKQKDLHAPVNSVSIRKIRGRIDGFRSGQGSAADLTDTFCSDVVGSIHDITFTACAVASSTETMSIDIQVNGATILDTPFIVDDSYPQGSVVHIEAESPAIAIGDKVEIIRDYTAGTPTPMGANVITIEVA
jgi:hypothetical protein